MKPPCKNCLTYPICLNKYTCIKSDKRCVTIECFGCSLLYKILYEESCNGHDAYKKFMCSVRDAFNADCFLRLDDKFIFERRSE